MCGRVTSDKNCFPFDGILILTTFLLRETNSGRTELRKVSQVLPRTLAAAIAGSAGGAIFLRARCYLFAGGFSVQANFNVRLPEAWLQARIFTRDSQEMIFTLQRRQFFRAAPWNLNRLHHRCRAVNMTGLHCL